MKFAKIISKIQGAPFKTNGTDEKGLDCLGLVYLVARKQGKKIPESFGEWNKENYATLYTEDFPRAVEMAEEYFDSFMERIDANFVNVGDVVILKNETSREFLAIYGGNGLCVSSFTDSGVRPIALSKNLKILKAWRFRNG